MKYSVSSPCGWLAFAFLISLSIPLGADIYTEDFEEPDGPPEDWVVYQPQVMIEDGQLSIFPGGVEPWAWAGEGGEPIPFENICRVSFRVQYLAPPSFDVVGRHGGVVLCAIEPTQRWGPTFEGYIIDWIDRAADHGYRVYHICCSGTHSFLLNGSPHADPGEEWVIEFEEEVFRFFVDGELVGEFDDAAWRLRSGYVGVYCYSNGLQHLVFDDMRIEYETCAPSCAKVKRSLPSPRFQARQEFEVTLSISDVCGKPEEPCTPPAAPETATIVETLPVGWIASDPTPPGVVGPENVVTWTFAGGSLKPMDLTYKVLPDDRCDPVKISGKLTCSGFEGESPIAGGGTLRRAGCVLPDGYVTDWLILGPYGDQNGCTLTQDGVDADYLTDGVQGELDLYPYAGLEIETDFVAAESSVYYGPLGSTDLPVWTAIYDNDGAINLNDEYMVGMPNDNVMAYAVAYVTNTTGQDMEDVYIAVGVDDSLQVIFDDGQENQRFTRIACQGWGWPAPQQTFGPVTLQAGIRNRIMVKCFEGGGGWGYFLRFQDASGTPIVDGIEIGLEPLRPLKIERSFSSASYTPGLPITTTLTLSEVASPPPTAVKITETLPAGWTATRASDGGAIAGRTVTWNLTGAAIANGKKVTYEATPPKGIAASFSGVFEVEGSSLRVTGARTLPRAPIPKENLSPWIAADIGAPLEGGQEKISEDAFNIWGGGADISARADGFRFIYQSTSGGDLTMWVRVEGQDATNPSAKAGLMVRQSLEAGSPFYFVQATPADGAGPRYRTTLNGNAGPVLPISARVALPVWLKLVRTSNTFTAFTSTDGSTWEQNFRTASHRNPRSIALTEPVLVGFAVTAADPEKVSGAMFRDFRCEGPGCPTGTGGAPIFHRGDVDGTGVLTIGDAIFLLNFQFGGGAKPGCLDACDVDDNGSLTIGDPIYLLNYMFASGPLPPPPGPPGMPCGPDPAGVSLGCENYPQAACQ